MSMKKELQKTSSIEQLRKEFEQYKIEQNKALKSRDKLIDKLLKEREKEVTKYTI